MLKPALAYPTTVLIKLSPLADDENTSISLVWAVIGNYFTEGNRKLKSDPPF